VDLSRKKALMHLAIYLSKAAEETIIRDTLHREFRYHRHHFNDQRENKLNRELRDRSYVLVTTLKPS